MKRPAFQFYPADWRKDTALQSCSIAARGLWIEALCVAHECEPYGHLTINGRPMNAAQIGRLIGILPKDCERLLAELMDAGVASRTDDGAFFSRRMVRDEETRQYRASFGSLGAEHGSKGKEFGKLGGRPRLVKGGNKPPIEPGPSSSSSSSEEKKEKTPRKAGQTSLPQDFCISERVREWAVRGGHTKLEPHFDALVSYARRKGAKYADWDEALMYAVREDWGKVGTGLIEAYAGRVL